MERKILERRADIRLAWISCNIN